MQTKLKVLFMCFFTVIAINSVLSHSQGLVKNKKETAMNNYEKEDIKIKVTDVTINKEEIRIDKVYPGSAILTIEVTNDGRYDMELSNIDITPYQGSIATKYFVSTSEDNITGFIGNLKSKDNKTIKIGVALHNTNDPINLEMNNINDIYEEKIIYKIDIK